MAAQRTKAFDPDEHVRRDEALEAKARTLSDAELKRLARELPTAGEHSDTYTLLKFAGERSVPYVLPLLASEECLRPDAREPRLGSFPTLALVLSLLRDYVPTQAVQYLAPLVHRAEKELRKLAGGTLISIASDECIEPMRVILADPEDSVRSFGMLGVRSAVEHKRGSPKFRAAAFEMLKPLLTRRTILLSCGAAELLLLDKERARAELLSLAVFSQDNPNIRKVIHALNEEWVVIPLVQLNQLLRHFPVNADSAWQRNIHGALVIAAAMAQHPELKQLIAAARKSPDKSLAGEAATALAISKGTHKPEDFIFDRAAEVGFKGLTVPQQHFYCVWSLSGEVDNGGFDQYYFNSAGDEARESEAALKAVGATKTLALLKKANALFGLRGPSCDRRKRVQQLEKLSKGQAEKMSNLGDQLCKDPDGLMDKLMAYVAEHPTDFKPDAR